MNNFFNFILLVMTWLFLVIAIILLFVLLSMNNGNMSASWHIFLAGIASSLFFSALAFVALKMSKYIDEQHENSNYYEAE